MNTGPRRTRRTAAALASWLAFSFPALAIEPPVASPKPPPRANAGVPEDEDPLLAHTGPDPVAGAKLVEQAVQWLGGAVALDSVATLVVVSKARRQTTAGEVNVTTTSSIAFPDRYRQDVAVPRGTVSTVLGPRGAFLVSQAGVLPLSEDERTAVAATVERNLIALLRRARRDRNAAWIGFENVAAVRVELVRVGGPAETTVGIDPLAGAVHRITYQSAAPGMVGRVNVTYSDFRTVGAIRYPYTSVGTLDDKPLFTNQVESVKVNEKLAASLFEPPAVPAN